MSSDRMPRADAVRNRARILETAEAVIAARGFEVPVSVIAKEIGVGVGTVYRHFPTKEALFGAILVNKLGDVAAAIDGFADIEDVDVAFGDFLSYMTRRTIADRSLYDGLAAATGVGLGPDGELGAGLYEAQRRLLERAQAAGAVRTDLGVADLKAVLAGAVAIAEHGTDVARVVEIITEGLRPRR